MRPLVCSLALLVFSPSLVTAAPESGPVVGEKVDALEVFDVTGNHQGKKVDYAKERAGKPTVYVFVPAARFSRPIARFLRKLDEQVDETDDGYVVAVWMTDDDQKSRNYLPRLQRAVDFDVTALCTYPSMDTSPGAWGVNSDVDLTVAVSDGKKVAATFAYVSVNETLVPEVTKAFRKAAGGK